MCSDLPRGSECPPGMLEVGGMLFSVSEEGAVLLRYLGGPEEAAVPETVSDGGVSYPVVAIGEGAFAGSDVRCVSVPGTVRRVEDGAFEGCAGLRMIRFEGIPELGNRCLALGSFDARAVCEVRGPEELLRMFGDPRSWACDPECTYLVLKDR